MATLTFTMTPFLSSTRFTAFLALWLCLSSGFAAAFGEGYSEDEADIREGRALFKSYCAACHDLGHDGIGPALGPVTLERDKDWLQRFIENPQALLDSGDVVAEQLVRKYGVVMPTFGLAPEEVEKVLAYLHARRRPLRERVAVEDGRTVVENPVPEKLRRAGIALDLELAWKVPASSEKFPRARINKLAGVRDGERDRLFVCDQNGFFYELGDEGPQLVLEMSKAFPDFVSEPGLATGFSSFAFSPDFESSRLVYTQHAERGDAKEADFKVPEGDEAQLQYAINEWRMEEHGGKSILVGPRELLRIEMIDTSHGMQELAFNPYAVEGDEDYGLLYVGVGDGGASYIRRVDLVEDGSRIWGKLLRIDPRGRDGRSGEYGIPVGNPFAGESTGRPAGLPEVYALGFRNPNTMAWSKGGELFVSDIGHWNVEELNRVVAGADYGWPRYEGVYEIDLKQSQRRIYARDGAASSVVDPVIQIDHDEIRAIAGGVIYEGERLPLLKGLYLFGGIATGRVFVADVKGAEEAEAKELQLFVEGVETTLSKMVNVGRADLRIGSDAAGEPFVLSKSDGSIWRVARARRIQD